MKLASFMFNVAAIILIISLNGCSSSPISKNDLAEYGYKGNIRELKTTMYYDFIEENGKTVYDESKVGTFRTMIFNKDGNLEEATNSFSDAPEEDETVYYQFKDGRKSSFYIVNPANDTLQRATFDWVSDKEYTYTSLFNTGRTMKSWSKLNDDFRDLSGGYTFSGKDTIYYSRSYKNTVIEDNLIKESISTDEVTGEKSTLILKYSDFDSKGNPQKVEMFDGDTKTPINVAIRKFSYFSN